MLICLFVQDGTIMNKAFRNLVLSVKLQSVVLANGEEKYLGYVVGLSEKVLPKSLDEKTDERTSTDESEYVMGFNGSR